VVSYRVMLDVPRDLTLSVSDLLLAALQREIGTRKGTRRLGCTGRRCSPWPGSGIRAISGGIRGGSVACPADSCAGGRI
jgi:hypothetical protein